MSDTPTVNVRGNATWTVPPEIATIRVQILALEQDRTRALRHATESTGDLQRIVEGYGVAIAKCEIRAVHVRPLFRSDGKKAKLSHYAASVEITLEVEDFSILGDLVLRIGEHDRVTLHGPHWAVRRDSPRHREVRLAAVRDARTRATEYAEALGGHLTGLVSITDVALNDSWENAPSAGIFQAHAASSMADEITLDLTPEEQIVSGAVDVRFVMSAPTFGS